MYILAQATDPAPAVAEFFASPFGQLITRASGAVIGLLGLFLLVTVIRSVMSADSVSAALGKIVGSILVLSFAAWMLLTPVAAISTIVGFGSTLLGAASETVTETVAPDGSTSPGTTAPAPAPAPAPEAPAPAPEAPAPAPAPAAPAAAPVDRLAPPAPAPEGQ